MKAATILSLLPLAIAAPASKRAGGPAPVLVPRDSGDNLIEGQYIVKLKNGMSISSVDDTLSLFEGEAEHEWKEGEFKGFAAKLDAAALDKIANHPDVSLKAISNLRTPTDYQKRSSTLSRMPLSPSTPTSPSPALRGVLAVSPTRL